MPPIKRSIVVGNLKRALVPLARPSVNAAGRLVIGYDRDLVTVGLSRSEADLLLENDVTQAISDALQAWAWLAKVEPEPRAAAIVELVAYRGVSAVALDRAFIAACAAGRYDEAADALLAHPWRAEREPEALRLARQVRTGKLQA